MRKDLWIILSTVLNIILLVLVFYFYSHRAYESVKSGETYEAGQSSKEEGSQKRFSIAIITPNSHPALDEIQRGFVEQAEKLMPHACLFDVYNANGSRVLMRSQIEEALNKEYDLFFTLGALTTQLAKELTMKKNKLTPIIFGAVADPVGLGLIRSEKATANHLTGVSTGPDYPQQIALLTMLDPSIKQALIVYDPTQSSGLEKDKKQAMEVFAKHGIKARAIEIYQPQEIAQKLPALLHEVDMVLVFKDNTILPAISMLINLCNKNNVLLYASDSMSVDKGAALGFGVYDYSFGSAAAKLAQHVLIEGKQPAEIPVAQIYEHRLKINARALPQQRLHIKPSLWNLLKRVEVVAREE